jgi:hypothetical protein
MTYLTQVTKVEAHKSGLVFYWSGRNLDKVHSGILPTPKQQLEVNPGIFIFLIEKLIVFICFFEEQSIRIHPR